MGAGGACAYAGAARARAAAPEEASVLLGEAYELMGLIDHMSDGQAPDRDALDAWSGMKRDGGG